MTNKIMLGIETITWGIYGITSAISLFIYVMYECEVISFSIPLFAGTTLGIWMMAFIALLCVILHRKITRRENMYNSIFTIPLSSLNHFVAFSIALIPTFMILSLFWKRNDWFGGPAFLCIASIVNVFVIMFTCRACTRFMHALRYNYNSEPNNVYEFLEKYPEEYKYMRPIDIPIEFLENHPEIAQKIHPKSLPQNYKDRHNI